MNIHEHQAKQILKKYGAVIPEGIFAFTVDELVEKAKLLKTSKYVLKAQIHAGGRGKAGGVKILDNIDELREAAKKLLGKIRPNDADLIPGIFSYNFYIKFHLLPPALSILSNTQK